MLSFLGCLQSWCLRPACVRGSIIHRQPGMCHRRYPSGLNLSFGGGRRGWFHGHSWKAFLAPETAFRFGVEPFPQQSVGNKVELKEVSLSVSAPWHKTLTCCQRCCVASQNCNLVAAVVCVRCFCPETLMLHARNNRYSLHSVLARWQTGNQALDPSEIHVHLCSFTGSQGPAEVLTTASSKCEMLSYEVFMNLL